MKDWTLTDLLEAYARARSDNIRADYADNYQIVKRDKAEAEVTMNSVEAEIERRCSEQD